MEARPRSGTDFDRLGNVWGLGGPDDQERLAVTTRFIEEHVRDPGVIVECGALRGALTDKLLPACPRATLHLIEIAPSHAAVLRERFADDERVHVHEADMLALPSLPIPSADAVLLIECLYYLGDDERQAFVDGIRSMHSNASLIVATPVTGGHYFTERSLRALLSGYHLVGVEVTARRPVEGWKRQALRLARRFDAEEAAVRALRRHIADHAIYAFTPSRRGSR